MAINIPVIILHIIIVFFGKKSGIVAVYFDGVGIGSESLGARHYKLVSKNNAVREAIFSGDWNWMPPMNWLKYKKVMKQDTDEAVGHSIKDIIDKDFRWENG